MCQVSFWQPLIDLVRWTEDVVEAECKGSFQIRAVVFHVLLGSRAGAAARAGGKGCHLAGAAAQDGLDGV